MIRLCWVVRAGRSLANMSSKAKLTKLSAEDQQRPASVVQPNLSGYGLLGPLFIARSKRPLTRRGVSFTEAWNATVRNALAVPIRAKPENFEQKIICYADYRQISRGISLILFLGCAQFCMHRETTVETNLTTADKCRSVAEQSLTAWHKVLS